LLLPRKEKKDPSTVVLLAAELRAYLDGNQDALAGVDEARVVLEAVIRRLERLGLPGVAGGEGG
jgi:hypothetical protein